MQRWVTIALAIAVVGMMTVGVISLFGIPVTSDIAPDEEPDPTLVELQDGQAIWPYYTSTPGDFTQRSAINIVFTNATTAEVVALLANDADWLETDEEEDDAGTEAFSLAELDLRDEDHPLGWGAAVGTQRFAYAEANGESRWLEESAQLHDGDYYGSRDHLRLYDVPGENPAVAIQAHSEHFDWFTLRHTVTSIEEAQSAVERDLMSVLGQEKVTRVFHGNDAVYDSDGWVTLVAAVLPLLLVLSAARREAERAPIEPLVEHATRRIGPQHLALVGTMVGIIFGVRFAGIVLERYTDIGHYWIAGGLFPFIGIGIPLAAYLLGRTFVQRMDAAMSASLGLAAAILLDYIYLGVAVLPIELLLHRGGLVVAVGLLAAGGAAHAAEIETTKRFVVGGAALWALLVAMSLFAVL